MLKLRALQDAQVRAYPKDEEGKTLTHVTHFTFVQGPELDIYDNPITQGQVVEVPDATIVNLKAFEIVEGSPAHVVEYDDIGVPRTVAFDPKRHGRGKATEKAPARPQVAAGA